jgi:phosphatidylinositol alpha-mannosyltransferase
VSLEPAWVLRRSALMCASMVLRAVSWHAILKAALPRRAPRFGDALQGTSIGVLMSATLPARLGEPSRALIVAAPARRAARAAARRARARSSRRRCSTCSRS